MEQQTLLAQELAARLALSQESEREYVKAEAELYAAKNLREEKEDRIEALVEKMAWNSEETALEKLAHENEIHLAEMKAEADTWKRKQDSGLQARDPPVAWGSRDVARISCSCWTRPPIVRIVRSVVSHSIHNNSHLDNCRYI